ncbi:uncharacterized protein LOC128883182 [Hylaeus volcanicus]|uniref:uncharacterized protein LOC128883182 n=1 Tax=Hylaeus volcanicus TaxID=313075 RepID=UPI0023B7B8FD|nr:uncharacterized protein LOC128883182 [Hylaeus volcanicus]
MDNNSLLVLKKDQTNEEKEKVPWWISRPYSLILKESFLSSHYEESILLTGIKSIDKFLGGGFHAGKIIEFVGEGGSGKTQWVLTLTVQVLLNPPKSSRQYHVLYIHTKAAFPIKRWMDILDGLTKYHSYKETVAHDLRKKLERLLLCHIKTKDELWNIFVQNYKFIKENVKLLIIDSISDIFRPLYYDTDDERLFEVNVRARFFLRFTKLINRIAVECNAFVILVNGVTQDIEKR